MSSTSHSVTPSGKPRARSLSIPLPGTPGPFNAITDVQGVEVGHVTLVEGDGPLRSGHGPVRTGVTAVLPRGRAASSLPCAAGRSTLNDNAELTGTHCAPETLRLLVEMVDASAAGPDVAAIVLTGGDRPSSATRLRHDRTIADMVT
jgi:D-aminopeptidase